MLSQSSNSTGNIKGKKGKKKQNTKHTDQNHCDEIVHHPQMQNLSYKYFTGDYRLSTNTVSSEGGQYTLVIISSAK